MHKPLNGIENGKGIENGQGSEGNVPCRRRMTIRLIDFRFLMSLSFVVFESLFPPLPKF
jgi:hypothetical protein